MLYSWWSFPEDLFMCMCYSHLHISNYCGTFVTIIASCFVYLATSHYVQWISLIIHFWFRVMLKIVVLCSTLPSWSQERWISLRAFCVGGLKWNLSHWVGLMNIPEHSWLHTSFCFAPQQICCTINLVSFRSNCFIKCSVKHSLTRSLPAVLVNYIVLNVLISMQHMTNAKRDVLRQDSHTVHCYTNLSLYNNVLNLYRKKE